jgi:hypothetical protein
MSVEHAIARDRRRIEAPVPILRRAIASGDASDQQQV